MTETFSDPKPEIAEPKDFDRDGNVISQMMQTDIDLTTDENKYIIKEYSIHDSSA